MNATTITILIGLTLRVLVPLLIVLVAGTLLQRLAGRKGA
jgi:hypothetical protein